MSSWWHGRRGIGWDGHGAGVRGKHQGHLHLALRVAGAGWHGHQGAGGTDRYCRWLQVCQARPLTSFGVER
jgi:hypothetical protein